MNKQITFIGDMGDLSEIVHGGVHFPKGKTVLVDTTKTEMKPWFEGNPTFVVEDIEYEIAEATETDAATDGAGSDDTVGSESAAEVAQEHEDERVEDSDERLKDLDEEEKAALRELLTEKGVKFRANASLETLRKLWDEAE